MFLYITMVKEIRIEKDGVIYSKHDSELCIRYICDDDLPNEDYIGIEESPIEYRKLYEYLYVVLGMTDEEVEKQNIQYYEEPINNEY